MTYPSIKYIFYALLLCSSPLFINCTTAPISTQTQEEKNQQLKSLEEDATPLLPEQTQDLEVNLEKSFSYNKEKKEKEEETKKLKDNLFNPMKPPTLEDIHGVLSDDIVSISESVDTFFINDRIIDGRNRTHLRVINSLNSIEREDTELRTEFRLRFRLPRLEEKIQVEVNNLDNATDTGANTVNTSSTTQIQNRDQRQNTTAGLSFFKDALGIRSKFTLGFVFRDFAPFGNFRLSKNIQFSETDNLNLIADIFGDTKDRTGQRTTIYYDHIFSKNYLFRVFNELLYRHEFHSFETQHGLTLFHTVNDRNSISYTSQIRSHNPPGISSYFLNSYDIFSTYRYRIYKNHAFFDLVPGVSFPKQYEFKSNWFCTIRLEILFGNV